MEYMVVEANSKEELEAKVNEYLRAEWKLQGGVAIKFFSNHTSAWDQALCYG